MVDPGTFDITIHQGATFSLDLQYKDSAGNGVNMSGYSVTSKIVDQGGADLATFVTSFVDQAHANQLAVHVYTLRADALPNYAKTFSQAMQVLIKQAQVDGVFTDFPDQARPIIQTL